METSERGLFVDADGGRIVAQAVAGFAVKLFEQLPFDQQDVLLNAMAFRFYPYLEPMIERQRARMREKKAATARRLGKARRKAVA